MRLPLPICSCVIYWSSLGFFNLRIYCKCLFQRVICFYPFPANDLLRRCFSAACRTFPTCIPSAQLILSLISGMHWLLHPCISICPCPTCSCELWCLIIRCHLHSCCVPLRSCFLQLFFGLIVSPMPDSICSVFCCNHIRCSLLGRLFVVAHFAALAENALTSFCKNLCFGNSFPSRAFSAIMCFDGIKLGPLTEKQGKHFFFKQRKEVPVRWEKLNIARIEFNFIWRV